MDPGTARTKAHTPHHHRLPHLWWKNDGKMHFDGEKCHLMLENLGKLRLHWWKKMHFDGAKLLIDGGTHFLFGW